MALAQSPHLRQLTDLHLKGQELSPASLRKLLSSPLMESLRSLTFAAFNDKHAQVLANHPGAAQLKHLRSIEITGSTGGLFRRNKYIYYQRGAIGKEGCQAIVNSPYLHLETFDVLETFAPQEIQQALAFAPTLSEEIRYGFLRAQNKTTLQKWAKEHNISGRSKMSQYTLCEALLSCV